MACVDYSGSIRHESYSSSICDESYSPSIRHVNYAFSGQLNLQNDAGTLTFQEQLNRRMPEINLSSKIKGPIKSDSVYQRLDKLNYLEETVLEYTKQRRTLEAINNAFTAIELIKEVLNEFDKNVSNEFDKKVSNEFDKKVSNEFNKKVSNEIDATSLRILKLRFLNFLATSLDNTSEAEFKETRKTVAFASDDRYQEFLRISTFAVNLCNTDLSQDVKDAKGYKADLRKKWILNVAVAHDNLTAALTKMSSQKYGLERNSFVYAALKQFDCLIMFRNICEENLEPSDTQIIQDIVYKPFVVHRILLIGELFNSTDVSEELLYHNPDEDGTLAVLSEISQRLQNRLKNDSVRPMVFDSDGFANELNYPRLLNLKIPSYIIDDDEHWWLTMTTRNSKASQVVFESKELDYMNQSTQLLTDVTEYTSPRSPISPRYPGFEDLPMKYHSEIRDSFGLRSHQDMLKLHPLQSLDHTEFTSDSLEMGKMYHGRRFVYHLSDDTWDYMNIRIRIKEKVEVTILGTSRDLYAVEYDGCIGNRVAKHYRNTISDPLGRYLNDIRAQEIARYYAILFAQACADELGRITILWSSHIQVFKDASRTEILDMFNVEKEVKGPHFQKFTNNTRYVNKDLDTELMTAFTHFTYKESGGKLMVVDLQGWTETINEREYIIHLTDPAIHCPSDGEEVFGNVNFGMRGFQDFWDYQHPKCNYICGKLGLDRENLGSDKPCSDKPCSDKPGSDKPGSDKPGSDKPGSDKPGSVDPVDPLVPGSVDQGMRSVHQDLNNISSSYTDRVPEVIDREPDPGSHHCKRGFLPRGSLKITYRKCSPLVNDNSSDCCIL